MVFYGMRAWACGTPSPCNTGVFFNECRWIEYSTLTQHGSKLIIVPLDVVPPPHAVQVEVGNRAAGRSTPSTCSTGGSGKSCR